MLGCHVLFLAFLVAVTAQTTTSSSGSCGSSVATKPGTKNLFQLLGHGYARQANGKGKGTPYSSYFFEDIAHCLRVCDEDDACVAIVWILRPHQDRHLCHLYDISDGIKTYGGIMLDSSMDSTSCWVKRPRITTPTGQTEKDCNFLFLGPGACYPDNELNSGNIAFVEKDILLVEECEKECLKNHSCTGYQFSLEDKCWLFLSPRDSSNVQVFGINQRGSKKCFVKSCLDQIDVPENWKCNPRFYNNNDGCDCNCGAHDPDCDKVSFDETLIPFGCKRGQFCNKEGQCQYGEWKCSSTHFNSNDGCHCNCGIYDPDCGNTGKCVDQSGCENPDNLSEECGGYLLDKFHSFKETCIDLVESDFSVGYIPQDISLWKNLSRLRIFSDNLKGSLPTELGQLTSLTSLYLYSKGLNGSIPTQLGELSSLDELHLYTPDITGNIPTQLGKLSSLRRLYLQSNVANSVPTQIGNLGELTDLNLGSSSLTGAVPTEIGRLKNLEFLEISNTGLSSIPREVEFLTKVKRFTVSKNPKMGSTLPSEIGGMTSLLVLDVHKNSMTGPIPSQLGNLLQLTRLNFDFGSDFPSEIGRLSKLESLNFYDTKINYLPSTIGNLTKLIFLNAFYNVIENFPPQIAELTSLRRLDLTNNNIHATIPASLGGLTALTYLRLAQNDFQGAIPPQLGNLTRLTSIFFKKNKLEGQIPSQFGELKVLRQLQLNNNLLSGTIPNRLSQLPSIKQLHLNSNHLRLTPSILTMKQLPGNVELFLADNEPTSCQQALLQWYPEFSVQVDDREQIKCPPDNGYGELDLSPHVLRIDPEAPGNSVERLQMGFSTFNQIGLFWDYDNSGIGTGETIRNPNECNRDQCRSALKEHIQEIKEVLLSSQCGSSTISRIQPFYDQFENIFVEIHLYGFEITWSKTDDGENAQKHLCMIASEVNESFGWKNFNHSINSNLKPFTEYQIVVTPFNLFVGGNSRRKVSGIPSHTLSVQTKEYIPENPPRNVRTLSRSPNSIQVTWDNIPPDEANGVITLYEVILYNNLNNEQIMRETTETNNKETPEVLSPNSEYRVAVRARTSVGWSLDWRNSSVFTTCPFRTKATSNGTCEADMGFFMTSEYTVQSCDEYPFQLHQSECQQTNRVQDLFLTNGWWRPNVNVISTSELHVCKNSIFCIQQTNYTSISLDSDRHCSKHHTGVLCSDCEEGYELSNADGCVICTQDEKESHELKVVTAVVVYIVIVLLWLCVMIYKTGIFVKKKKSNKLDGKWKRFAKMLDIIGGTKFRILFGFFQVFYSIERTISTRIPTENTGANWLKAISSAVATLDVTYFLEFVEIHCHTKYGHYQSLLIYTLAPLCTLTLFALVYHILKERYPTFQSKLRQEFFYFFFMFTFVIYPGVSQKILETFLCAEFSFPDGKKSYLIADYRISCDNTNERIAWVIYASVCFIIFPIGIFVIYVYSLVNCKNLVQKGNKTFKERKKLKRVESLIKPYTKEVFWFEAYELIRKFMLTSVVAILAQQSGNNVQIATGALVLCIFALCILFHLKPYKYAADFYFGTISLIILCFTTQIHGLSTERYITDVKERKTFEEGRYNILLVLECVIMILISVSQFVFFRPEIPIKNGSSSGLSKTTSTLTGSEVNESVYNKFNMDSNSMDEIFKHAYDDETRTIINKLKSEISVLKLKVENKNIANKSDVDTDITPA